MTTADTQIEEKLEIARARTKDVLDVRRDDLKALQEHIDKVQNQDQDEAVAKRAISRLRKRADSHAAEGRKLIDALRAVDAADRGVSALRKKADDRIEKREMALEKTTQKLEEQKESLAEQKAALAEEKKTLALELAATKKELAALKKDAAQVGKLEKSVGELGKRNEKLLKAFIDIKRIVDKT